MTINKISVKKFNIKLTKPFSYFGAKLDFLPYMLTKIEIDNGLQGYGEASLAWDITGETQQGVLGILGFVKPLLEKKVVNRLQDIEKIMQEINNNIYGNSALKASVELALLDVLGKTKKQPVYKLFGGKNKKCIIAQKTFSYEEVDLNNLKEKINIATAGGVKIFKFKAGLDKKRDLDLVKKITKDNPKIKIVLDVNQGWQTSENAIPVIGLLEKFNIAWIEQPIRANDYDGLTQIRKKTNIPIMVDESCHNLLDLENLHQRKALDLINIKLAKCGGIIEALKMVSFCDQRQIKYMLGDMISSALGTAANLHMATLGNFASFDITMPNRIKSDLFDGLKFNNFKAFIPQRPGLGVKIKNNAANH